MKKYLIIALGFLLLVTGCKNTGGISDSEAVMEPKITPNSNRIEPDGIYAYILGTYENGDTIVASDSTGTSHRVQTENGQFQVSVLPTTDKQEINLSLKNSDGEEAKSTVEVLGLDPIDNYSDFADKMNLLLPLVNDATKTVFPKTVSDGSQKVADENGVETFVNVEGGKLMALELRTKVDANKEVATIISVFTTEYGISSSKIPEAYNNTLETQETNFFVSNGMKFTFSFNEGELFSDIVKIKE